MEPQIIQVLLLVLEFHLMELCKYDLFLLNIKISHNEQENYNNNNNNNIIILLILFRWECTNLENAFAFCDIGERLANPDSDESNCKRCAYVDHSTLQLTSIHCDEKNNAIRNYVCQKSTILDFFFIYKLILQFSFILARSYGQYSSVKCNKNVIYFI